MIFNFIWRGKPSEIKKMTLVGEKSKGGLKMIDFEVMTGGIPPSKFPGSKEYAKTLTPPWTTLTEHFFREQDGVSFLLNCRYNAKLLNLNNAPPFYHAILKYRQENKPIILEDNPHKQNEIIWSNNKILINKKKIYLKQWHRTGIPFINDLFDEN